MRQSCILALLTTGCVALGSAGCAQVESGTNSSTGGTSGKTTGTTGSTTGTTGSTTGSGGSDLAGLDLSSSSGLPDFGGHDLAVASGDMATICDPVKQTGCGAGLKCTLGNDGPACATNGTVMTGLACGSGTSDDCISGDICLEEATSLLLCRQFCNTDSDCKQGAVGPSGNTGHCIITISGAPQKACTTPCNPVTTGTTCPTGLSCIYGSTMTINELTNCEKVGTNGDKVACASIDDCAPGYTCVSINMMPSTCAKVCSSVSDCSGIGSGYMCNKNTGDNWGTCF